MTLVNLSTSASLRAVERGCNEIWNSFFSLVAARRREGAGGSLGDASSVCSSCSALCCSRFEEASDKYLSNSKCSSTSGPSTAKSIFGFDCVDLLKLRWLIGPASQSSEELIAGRCIAVFCVEEPRVRRDRGVCAAAGEDPVDIAIGCRTGICFADKYLVCDIAEYDSEAN